MKKLYVLTLCLMAVAVAGCGGNLPLPGKEEPSMNLQQAAEKADGITAGTLDNVNPGVSWAHGTSTGGLPDGASPGEDESDFVTRRAAVMTVVSKQRRGNLLGVIERNWKSHGYEITGVNKDKKFPAIYAKTPEGFQLSLDVGNEGQFFLDVLTPDAQMTQVSPPTVKDSGRSHIGEDFPAPNVHSDFWSDNSPPPSKS